MVFLDDDQTAYMYYCTAVQKEDGSIREASGVAVSNDMFHWKDQGTFYFDACAHSPESPFVLKRKGIYYFFYTSPGRGTAYAISDNPVSGWIDRGMLIETKGLYQSVSHVPSCSEVFQYKGKWYISCAERHPGCEQYLEIYHITWNSDGSITVGQRLE